MPQRIAITTLNASTVDILNAIRANANYEYQTLVPEITKATEIPRVGQVLLGYPALANQFVNALVNRIALVRVKSATFNNAYAHLKKGYLEFGETVEEVFVNIAKAREFSVEKAEAREFKRTLPDVRSAFHTINWKVQYPVTVQFEDLRMAFTNAEGVQDLIAKIIDSVYTAAEYDEFLLFKYLLIKAISKGKMYPVSIGGGATNEAAVAFRAMSNKFTFMKKDYNAAGVTTVTDKNSQYIFMDSDFNADFDVNVLASAFNMEKADFMGRLHLIDDWKSFDNDRFDEIRKNSDMIEEVTAEELALLADVKAVLVDEEWFQVYDNLTNFSEARIASGIYWNYFLNVWKTVSYSPFSNAAVFVTDNVDVALPDSLSFEVTGKSISEAATILTLEIAEDEPTIGARNYNFVQGATPTELGIAVHRYGGIIFPANVNSLSALEITVNNQLYRSAVAVTTDFEVGNTIAFNKVQ